MMKIMCYLLNTPKKQDYLEFEQFEISIDLAELGPGQISKRSM